jgi:hypothetical protein
MKFLKFWLESDIEIMPEARSESNSETNKKNMVCTLVHFLRYKTADIQKLVKFNCAVNDKRLSFIYVNP